MSAGKSRPLPQSKGSTPSASSNGSKPANAWSRPLQRKPGPPPGMEKATASEKKPILPPPPPVLRERFLHLSLSLVGHKVVVTRTNGSIIEGILHTFTPFASQPKERRNMYVLKACKSIQPATDGTEPETIPTGGTILLPVDQVSSLVVKSMRLDTASSNINTPNHSSHGKSTDPFRTDTEISGTTQDAKGGELVMAGSAWTSAGNTKTGSRADALLDEGKGRKGFGSSGGGSGLRGTIGQWDQFKANEELFQVSATFDENVYTTQLDKSQIDARKRMEAERLAREIESTTSTNVHVAEERGHLTETDFDEEDRYSGVLRKQPTPKTAPSVKTTARSQEAKAEKLAKKTMNYAAAAKADVSKKALETAAAKPDASKQVVPPGFADAAKPPAAAAASATVTPKAGSVEEPKEEEKKESKPESEPILPSTKHAEEKESPTVAEEPKKDTLEVKATLVSETPPATEDIKKKDAPTPVTPEMSEAPNETTQPEKSETKHEAEVEQSKAQDTETKEEEPKKVATKLNANAKEFTFNPSAKSFTPTGGGAATAPAQQQQQQQQEAFMYDPNTGMQIGQMPMPQPHHMQHPSMPGMMPMMNAPYMRYQGGPFPGMDQPVTMLPPQQPQQVQRMSPAQDGVGSQSSGDEQQQAVDGAMPPQAQHLHQQQAMPVTYGGPGSYYPGMMPPRSGGPPMYQPIAGTQQMTYRQMYGGPMPGPGSMPAMPQMRGSPYYPNPAMGGMQYPQPGGYPGGRMMEDDFRSRGRGRSGRSRRGSFKGGRGGRGGYQSGGGSGRQTPQSNSGAEELGDGASATGSGAPTPAPEATPSE